MDLDLAARVGSPRTEFEHEAPPHRPRRRRAPLALSYRKFHTRQAAAHARFRF